MMEEEPGNPEEYLIIGLIPKPKETSLEKELQDAFDLVKKDLESRIVGQSNTRNWSLTGIDVSDHVSAGTWALSQNNLHYLGKDASIAGWKI